MDDACENIDALAIGVFADIRAHLLRWDRTASSVAGCSDLCNSRPAMSAPICDTSPISCIVDALSDQNWEPAEYFVDHRKDSDGRVAMVYDCCNIHRQRDYLLCPLDATLTLGQRGLNPNRYGLSQTGLSQMATD